MDHTYLMYIDVLLFDLSCVSLNRTGCPLLGRCLLTRMSCAWYQASAAKWLKTALFWVITQRVAVIYCRRFGTTYRSHPQGSRLQKVCPVPPFLSVIQAVDLHFFWMPAALLLCASSWERHQRLLSTVVGKSIASEKMLRWSVMLNPY